MIIKNVRDCRAVKNVFTFLLGLKLVCKLLQTFLLSVACLVSCGTIIFLKK
jgi:hypothetical protein